MDLTTTTAPTKIPETDNETQPNKSFSFTNGALKKHHNLTAAPPPPAVVVTYKECLKNHAASLGGHALDGCGEFMPSSTATPTNPTSLKCAACGCHRNFHRREPDEPTTYYLEFRRNPPAPPPQRASPSPSSSPSPSPSPPPPPPRSYYSSAPHMLLALSTGVPHDDQPAMNHNPVATPATPTAVKSENPSGRKRFRTRFSQEQKEKMLSFSEKLGWKMQKCDERSVEEFCNEVGVGKGVLKVWMHNNKYTLSKRDLNSTATATATATTTTTNNSNNMVSLDHDGHDTDINNSTTTNSSHHNNEINGVHLHVSTNGSSSSS